jgi:carbonic anhydrase
MKQNPNRHCLAVASLLLLLALSSVRGDDPAQPAAKQITSAEALERLKQGNARFVADKPIERKLKIRRLETADKQKPFAIILTCADSRVGPELVFDQSLGDVFVIRVAGNTATDASIVGSIEYGITQFHVPLIVVLGHEKCGAVAAALEGGNEEGSIGAVIKQVYVGDKAGKNNDAKLAAAVRVNAKYQTSELLKRSKIIAEMVKGERVQIVTGVYNLKSGEVEWLPTALKNGK